MNRYQCPECKGNQYSADSRKEKEPCIYCGHEGTKLMDNINEDKKTLQEWAKQNGITILDPDGFDRSDPKLMEKLFTYEEYSKGIIYCTVGGI